MYNKFNNVTHFTGKIKNILNIIQPVDIVNVKNLYLLCEANGNPKPTITWRNGGSVIGNSEKISIDVSKKLTFNTYECEATNNIKTVKSEIKLKVILPPKILSYTAKLAFSEKKRLTISCPVTGDLDSIIWFSVGIS